jgi:hypothetical protein
MDTTVVTTKTETNAMYRAAIVSVLEDFHQLNLKAGSDLESILESMLICDDRSQNYLLVLAGWQGNTRIKQVQIHLRLLDDRIWIEEDWTEEGVVYDLMRLGVDREAIELAFLPPKAREFADV